MLILGQGRLSTLLGHTADAADGPLRRDCGHRSDACQLALSAHNRTAEAFLHSSHSITLFVGCYA